MSLPHSCVCPPSQLKNLHHHFSTTAGPHSTHIHTDEDEAILKQEAELAAIDQAMASVADDMPVLPDSATSSSKAENSFGQQAAHAVKQSSTAADAGTCISPPPPSPRHPAYPCQHP